MWIPDSSFTWICHLSNQWLESSLLSQHFPSSLFTQWLPCLGSPNTGILQCTDPASRSVPCLLSFMEQFSGPSDLSAQLMIKTPMRDDQKLRFLWLHLSYVSPNEFYKYLASYQDVIINHSPMLCTHFECSPCFFESLKFSPSLTFNTVLTSYHADEVEYSKKRVSSLSWSQHLFLHLHPLAMPLLFKLKVISTPG